MILGETYYELEEFRRAMECDKKSLNIAKEVGDRNGKGSAYLQIGNVHRSLGDVAISM